MTAPADQSPLNLCATGTGETFTFSPQRLVIAGYTARDRAAAQHHIDELAEIGVAPPPRVPMFYEVPTTLATTDPNILVESTQTSGEVEPVLIKTGGRWYLGIGSDHTDREVETRDIAESKASAPKPLGSNVIPLDDAVGVWDDIEVVCRLDGQTYQQGTLSAMIAPQDLLEEMASRGDSLAGEALMFCGTLPLLGGKFVFGSNYELELRLPDGRSLHHTYDVKRRDFDA